MAHQVRRALFDLCATQRSSMAVKVDFTGDGLFCGFESATDAVDAAVEMQQVVTSFNHRQPADRQLSVRIGLSTGEPSENRGRAR